MTEQQCREISGSGDYSRRAQPLSLLCRIAFASLLIMTACGPAQQKAQSIPPSAEWHEFQGTWTATGSRNMMNLGGERQASISNFNGSLLLAGPSRPSVGFRADAIVFSDSLSGMVGRAVWTDERGDQVFSELRGQGSATDNKIVGTFLGGTGRYSGATGGYEFSWRFVIENEDGNLQGQSLGLNGRVRVDSPHPTTVQGGPQS